MLVAYDDSAVFAEVSTTARIRFHADGERTGNDTVVMEPAADRGPSLMAYSAAPGSPSQEALDLPAGWAATADREQAASSNPEQGDQAAAGPRGDTGS